MVLNVDETKREVTVSHREIPGVMPRMVMPFPVAPAEDLRRLHPGSRVRFQLRTTRRASSARHFELERVPPGPDDPPLPTLLSEAIPFGQPLPSLALQNQRSETVNLADLRGKVIAIQFLYTRCPLPEVCPRLAASFAQLQRRFAAEMGQSLVLVSITLDPQYDTPAVLAGYARRWRASLPGWQFLTGSQEEVGRAARALGLVYWAEEGVISHTSRTVIIDRQGNLAAAVEGASFDMRQLGDLIADQLRRDAS